jgi:hypothetical protein
MPAEEPHCLILLPPARSVAHKRLVKSQQVLRAIRVWTGSKAWPIRFIWRDPLSSGRIINRWRLRDRWWGADRFSDRTCYRLITCDRRAFNHF